MMWIPNFTPRSSRAAPARRSGRGECVTRGRGEGWALAVDTGDVGGGDGPADAAAALLRGDEHAVMREALLDPARRTLDRMLAAAPEDAWLAPPEEWEEAVAERLREAA